MVRSPDIQGAKRVREVFARVRNGDVTVADLYAEDAVLIYGSGQQIRGREAIRGFYEQTIKGIRPKPEVEAVLEDDPRYVAIVNVSTTEGTRRALDLFHMENGEICSLEIFSHGSQQSNG